MPLATSFILSIRAGTNASALELVKFSRCDVTLTGQHFILADDGLVRAARSESTYLQHALWFCNSIAVTDEGRGSAAVGSVRAVREAECTATQNQKGLHDITLINALIANWICTNRPFPTAPSQANHKHEGTGLEVGRMGRSWGGSARRLAGVWLDRQTVRIVRPNSL